MLPFIIFREVLNHSFLEKKCFQNSLQGINGVCDHTETEELMDVIYWDLSQGWCVYSSIAAFARETRKETT